MKLFDLSKINRKKERYKILNLNYSYTFDDLTLEWMIKSSIILSSIPHKLVSMGLIQFQS